MINIVLIEPEIPQNTGNVARTCSVTGARLHLVGPLGFAIDDAKLKRAGLDYWDKLNITYYADTLDFLERNKGGCFYFFETHSEQIFTSVSYPDDVFLIFGKETAGLSAELLSANAGYCVRIPMKAGLRSLNLSNSVAIGLYEVLRQHGYAELEGRQV